MPARNGLIGEAHGGTLFLDEIGECPKEVQAQLLRVMDHGEYQADGESSVRRVDVRIVGATNRDDSFGRDDFLARFLVRLCVPSLRERREDIPLLIRHLLLLRAQEFPPARRFLREGPDGRLDPRIDARLVDQLVRHPLPANTGELDTILVRAIESSPGDELTMPPEEARPRGRSLLPRPAAPGGPTPLGPPPKEEVVACLEREQGNVARAATALGIGLSALYRLMGRYGIGKKRKTNEPGALERREDILLLVRHFLLSRAQQFPDVRKRFLRDGPDGRLEPRLSARLVDHLVRHPLRLNTRELDAILVRAIETMRATS